MKVYYNRLSGGGAYNFTRSLAKGDDVLFTGVQLIGPLRRLAGKLLLRVVSKDYRHRFNGRRELRTVSDKLTKQLRLICSQGKKIEELIIVQNDGSIQAKDLTKFKKLCEKISLLCVDEEYFHGGCHFRFPCDEVSCDSCPFSKWTKTQRQIYSGNLKLMTTCDHIYITALHQIQQIPQKFHQKVKFKRIPQKNHSEQRALDPESLTRELKEFIIIADNLDDKRKGIREFIERWLMNNADLCVNKTFFLIGNAPRNFPKLNNVKRLGRVNYEQLLGRLSEVDLLLVPSISDTHPSIIFDAGIVNTAVATSRSCGIGYDASMLGKFDEIFFDINSKDWAIATRQDAYLKASNMRAFLAEVYYEQ